MASHPDPPPPPKPESPRGQETPSSDAVWTFRGYRLRASEFTTAMVHFFRAEVARANTWRMRLDATTNWAVVTTGAAISIAYSQVTIGNHFVIFLNLLLVTMFLVIEARRYRYYELWSYRVRLMETDFFAAMLVPPFHPAPDWAEALAENLLHPHYPISNIEAIGRRLRRNYLWIYSVLITAWLVKLWLHPILAPTWTAYIERATVGPISGEIVILLALVFYGSVVAFSLLTIGLQESPGEVLPRYGEHTVTLAHAAERDKKQAWYRPSRRRSQLLTLVITDKAKPVADRIMKDLNRGVTALSGTGMYTGQAHNVLMCALTVTEVPQLKALVAIEDPNAFVVVAPAQEIFGRGFMPLKEEE